uniref:CFA20 domain-containing protein n=1 Tax=Leptobrachium leishanense TaxID=445787 RepID=A0A8C5QEA4_9ANUR
MFKNEYQGGSYVEIFSSQGKDPVAKWKLCGSQSAIFKDFDKEVKSFVFVLEGSSQTNKMQLPKENKQMLGLIQRFLVLQVHIPLGQDFSAELLITDLTNIKRRLYLSTVHKELSATPLHAKIPLLIIKRKVWCNLCIDLVAFTSGIFKGAIFQSLDGIVISANCKLRRIFTMKLRPQDTADEKGVCTPYSSGSEPTDAIPRTCQITTDVHQVTQVLDLEKLRPTEARQESKLLIAMETDQLTNRGQGSAHNITQRNQSHIAFGSKVLGPPPSNSRKPSSRSLAETSRSSGRQDRSLLQLPLEKGIGSANRGVGRTSPPKLTPSSDQRGKEIVQQRPIQEPYPCVFNPHLQNEPPDADRRRSTISREESADKDQTVVLVDGSSLGHCGNRDKRPVQIHMPSCERTNRAPALNNSSVQSQSTTLSGDWSYREESELYDSHPDTTTSEEPKQSEDHLEEEDYVFAYSSVPRTTPCGKSHSYSTDKGSPSLDELQNNTRGAQMEEDFYGSDSSRERSYILKSFIHFWTQVTIEFLF